eukprot:1153861-Pelagomonas_calceolata.AAC.3
MENVKLLLIPCSEYNDKYCNKKPYPGYSVLSSRSYSQGRPEMNSAQSGQCLQEEYVQQFY